MMAMAQHYDAFISYNSRDRAQVETIIEWLEQKRGLRLYYDRRAGMPGHLWVRELGEALDGSQAAVVCVGPQGFSTWQQREICYALERHGRDDAFRVIPVMLPGSEPPLSMLKLYTWVDFRLGAIDEGYLGVLAAAIAGEPPGLEAQRAAHDLRERANPSRLARLPRRRRGIFLWS